MDNVTVIWVVTLAGAFMGTIVPYALKAFKDPTLSFDINYAYALVLGIIVQSVGLIPDSVSDLSMKVIMTAFVTGYGAQSIINRVVSTTNK